MADKEWRPPKWVTPGYQFSESEKFYYEAGASAMYKAVIEWLDGFCNSGHFPMGMKVKRRICEGCMAELKGEK